MSQTGTVRSDLWRVIHKERAALVDDLAGLTPEQWATPLLCGGWNVHDVVAHLAATATLSLPRFAKEFLLAGFSSGRTLPCVWARSCETLAASPGRLASRPVENSKQE